MLGVKRVVRCVDTFANRLRAAVKPGPIGFVFDLRDGPSNPYRSILCFRQDDPRRMEIFIPRRFKRIRCIQFRRNECFIYFGQFNPDFGNTRTIRSRKRVLHLLIRQW